MTDVATSLTPAEAIAHLRDAARRFLDGKAAQRQRCADTLARGEDYEPTIESERAPMLSLQVSATATSPRLIVHLEAKIESEDEWDARVGTTNPFYDLRFNPRTEEYDDFIRWAGIVDETYKAESYRGRQIAADAVVVNFATCESRHWAPGRQLSAAELEDLLGSAPRPGYAWCHT